MQIVLVTDAWHPQINGVVHTWTYMQRELTRLGHGLHVISPQGSRSIAAPTEPDIRLSIEPRRHVLRQLEALLGSEAPDALHIATEGPLGWAARKLALQRGWPFTTSYHTRFPEYMKARIGLPARFTYYFMRRFHAPAQNILVPTSAMRDELEQHGFRRLRIWSRGVDTDTFQPGHRTALSLPRPIFLYAGRIAPEKNIEAFLNLDLPGSKVIAGGGPEEMRLRQQYPQAHWLGMQPHAALAPLYDAADVFVFPSLTDTFGLVMLEAAACGCPTAAFPVTGPMDVVQPGVTGVLNTDLRVACLSALNLDRQSVRAHAQRYTWQAIAQDLLNILVPISPLNTTTLQQRIAH